MNPVQILERNLQHGVVVSSEGKRWCHGSVATPKVDGMRMRVMRMGMRMRMGMGMRMRERE